jgi:hypothetical protein
MNYLDCANEKIFTLPTEFQETILNYLNVRAAEKIKLWHIQHQNPKLAWPQANRDKIDKEIEAVIQFLNELEIYPVYGWAGHRGEYFFPTYEDCVMQEDYVQQCADYE